MKWDELNTQQCAIARFLGVLGDRWSLLIVSDAFLGVKRFETYSARLGISRTMLSDRLQSLCKNGIFEKVAYQHKPARYEYRLTAKGLDLHPVVMAMSNWGNQHNACEGGPPIEFTHTKCQHKFTPIQELQCSECGEPVAPWEIEAHARADAPDLPPVVRGPLKEDVGV